MTTKNPWKYAQVDEVDVHSNPYLNPSPKPADPLPDTSAAGNANASPVTVASAADFLVLQGITCIDANNNVLEHHPELRVRKNIFRDQNNAQVNHTPYDWIVHCEQNGLFLASYALTCNIVAGLYKNRNNPDANALLQQYKNHGNGHGYQAQNTIINYVTEEVIHYPSATDYNQTAAVNAGQRRKTGNFAKATLQDSLLEDALKDAAHILYVKQLTGLADPADLVEIGKYFGKPARLWFPWSGQAGATFNEKRAAWFGCDGDSLDLGGYGNLNDDGAARGVRGERQRAGAVVSKSKTSSSKQQPKTGSQSKKKSSIKKTNGRTK